MSVRIRFERTVCDAFDEKLFVSVEKELRLGRIREFVAVVI
jgi:hypothetical protein